MFATIRHWLGRSYEPRSEYFSIMGECGASLKMLRTTVRPVARGRHFANLTLGFIAASHLHPRAFGANDLATDGRLARECLANRGKLYEALMECEHAIAYGHDRIMTCEDIEARAGCILNNMVSVGGMTNKIRDELADAMMPSWGEYTVREGIESLPFPGTDHIFD